MQTAIVSHEKYLLDTVNTLFNKESVSDTTLNINGEKIYVIRQILSSKSIVFAKMFNGSFIEKNQSEILIMDDNIENNTFRDFLLYMYTGQIEITNDNAFDLVYMADKYDVVMLVNECVTTIMSFIQIDSLSVIWNSVNALNIEKINHACLKFFCENLDKIILDDTLIITFTPDIIKYITSSNQTSLPEIILFNFVHKWILLTNPVENIIQDIIANIHMPLIKIPDLVNIVRPSNLINDKVFIEAIEFQTSPGKFDGTLKKFKPRTYSENIFIYYSGKTITGYRQITNDDITPRFLSLLEKKITENNGLPALDDLIINSYMKRRIGTSTHYFELPCCYLYLEGVSINLKKNDIGEIYKGSDKIHPKDLSTVTIRNKTKDDYVGIYVASYMKF